MDLAALARQTPGLWALTSKFWSSEAALLAPGGTRRRSTWPELQEAVERCNSRVRSGRADHYRRTKMGCARLHEPGMLAAAKTHQADKSAQDIDHIARAMAGGYTDSAGPDEDP